MKLSFDYARRTLAPLTRACALRLRAANGGAGRTEDLRAERSEDMFFVRTQSKRGCKSAPRSFDKVSLARTPGRVTSSTRRLRAGFGEATSHLTEKSHRGVFAT